ncbi:hypothetical protein VTO42DRAFT_920 [Malbranchea cinnamomea]
MPVRKEAEDSLLLVALSSELSWGLTVVTKVGFSHGTTRVSFNVVSFPFSTRRRGLNTTTLPSMQSHKLGEDSEGRLQDAARTSNLETHSKTTTMDDDWTRRSMMDAAPRATSPDSRWGGSSVRWAWD